MIRYLLLPLLLVPLLATHKALEPPYQPKIAPASNEAELAIARFKLPPGFKAEVWAAEPQLANPVAFCFDEQGRCFVAETYRLHEGVIDIRGYMRWLDDDLACRTVADRLAFMRRRMGRNFEKMSEHPDRIVRLADPKGAGRATESIVVSDDFRTPETGLGAGLLAQGDTLWYANIPALWKLKLDADGKAIEKRALHDGFGVHFGFIGHDLHGLTRGPDGKLYFTIGDRGATVTTGETPINNPDSGAVFRCNPDGSELELYATGLRNPQELAFDDFGNLFTHDNNCDAGDQCRITFVMSGGDYGWRIGWQFFEQPRPRAAWMSEAMWKAGETEKIGYLVPPVANLAAGPSGLVYYPGTGLPEQYAGCFFVCDFRGGAQGSGIQRFRLEPKGAGFALRDHEEFMWNVLATDVDFGPDGALYVLDWVSGWNKPDKGRIYRVTNPALNSPIVAETTALIREDLTKREPQDLIPLLGHADRRVRLAAQFALVDLSLGRVKGGMDTLLIPPAISLFASQAKSQVARAQALMTLAMIAKHEPIQSEGLLTALSDADPVLRGVAARGIATAGLKPAARALVPLLADADSSVRRSACEALGILGYKAAVPAIIKMLEENADQDAYLRAVGAIALARLDDRPALHAALRHPASAVRRATAVALRRLADPQIAELLADPDLSLVKEAAWAISEVPIPAAFPALADRLKAQTQPDLVWYAALQAAFVLGDSQQAKAVAQIAARKDLPELVRYEALEMLSAWSRPNGKCRFTGLWRPLEPRAADIALAAVKPHWREYLTSTDRLAIRALRLFGSLPLPEAENPMVAIALDQERTKELRRAGLNALTSLQSKELPRVVATLLTDREETVRAHARRILVSLEPQKALPLLTAAIEKGTIAEQQSAIQILGDLNGEEATALLRRLFEQFLNGGLPRECGLDLVEAYQARDCAAKTELLARHQAQQRERFKALAEFADCLTGGDADRGKAIFLKQELTCLKCHKYEKEGGEVGPDLTQIAKDKTREYLLESIVLPNATIAKGYEAILVLTEDGKIHTGVLKSEDDREIRLLNADGEKVVELVIPKNTIEERKAAKSAMPEDLLKQIPPRDLRDLIEFLATRK